MKRNLILFLLLLFLTTTKSTSQTFSAVGLKGGLSYSTMTYACQYFSYPDFKYRLGYSADIIIEYWNHNYFNLETEIGFIQKGGKYTKTKQWADSNLLNPNVPEFSEDWITSFMTIDLLFKLKLPGDMITPYILVGPKLDYPMGYNKNVVDFMNFKDSLNNDLKSSFIGLKGGIGVEIGKNRWKFLVESQYIYNYNGFKKEKKAPEYNDKALAFYIGLVYKLDD
jgi:hypothetical protein